jgi:hypothetical protein
MRRTLTTAALLNIAVLSGCAASGPVQIGHDTDMASNTGAWSRSSGGKLTGKLFQHENAFCRSKGKEVQPIDKRANDGSFTDFANATLQFDAWRPATTSYIVPRTTGNPTW